MMLLVFMVSCSLVLSTTNNIEAEKLRLQNKALLNALDEVSVAGGDAAVAESSLVDLLTSHAESSPLVDLLTSQLPVSTEQAFGGTEALLGLALFVLSDQNGSELRSLVPELMNDLLYVETISQVQGIFDKLGMDPAMMTQFAPIILDYLGHQGASDGLLSSLSGLLIRSDAEEAVGMFVVIFGRPASPFTVRCKEHAETLKAKRDDFNYRYVDIHAEGISKADLEKTIGHAIETVPQIFIDQTHIGGCTEFEAYAKEHLGLFDESEIGKKSLRAVNRALKAALKAALA